MTVSQHAVDGPAAPSPAVVTSRAQRGRARPVVESDLPGLSALYVRVYGIPPGESEATAAAYLKRLLFAQPWRDPELPSLMYEDADGRPAGLLGVVPRPMSFRGRPIRVAVCHHFMVAPETRGTLASVALTKTLLAGPQDLTVADACAPWRHLWEHIGGATSLVHSLTWTRVVRPSRFAVEFLHRRGLPSACASALRPLSHLTDRVTSRVVPMFAAPAPSRLVGAAVDVDGLLSAMHQLCVGSLQPVWNRHTLQWALDQLRAKVHRGTLFAVGLTAADGASAGCYLYYLKPGGVSQLAYLSAPPEHAAQALAHVVRHAWEHGTGAIAGQFDRAMSGSLATTPAVLAQPDDLWRLVHSGRDDLLNAVHSGEAPLSRFESEWWLTF